jgi:hypothetical protein
VKLIRFVWIFGVARFKLMNDILFWINIVVKIALIKIIYMCFTKYGLRPFSKSLEDHHAINFEFPIFSNQHVFSIWNRDLHTRCFFDVKGIVLPFTKTTKKNLFFQKYNFILKNIQPSLPKIKKIISCLKNKIHGLS